MLRPYRNAGFAIALAFLLASSCETPSTRGVSLFQRTEDAELAAKVARATGTLVREGGCLRLRSAPRDIVVWPNSSDAYSPEGGGTTVIIWARGAAAEREGGGTVVIIWSRGRGSGEPVRTGERVELEGRYVEDVAAFPIAVRNAGACRSGPAFVVREARPAR